MRETMPPDAPKALEKWFLIGEFVDTDFSGNKVSSISSIGLIVFLNGAPVYWLSKKQSACDTSYFGSECIAMKQCCEYLKGLRYKLIIMGIPLNNPYFVYGDKKSVLWNTSVLEYTLKNKTCSVEYTYFRQGVSLNVWRTTYINTKENSSGKLTKNLPAVINMYMKVSIILYDIYSESKYL